MNSLLQSNLQWMAFNISLAIIPVFLGWFMVKSKSKWMKAVLVFFWLIFLPNSMYLFADITHLFEQWDKVDQRGIMILLVEYSFVLFTGLLTYIYALYPFETMIYKTTQVRRKVAATVLLIFINFLVGFAITLGRIHRINSWDILTNFTNVIDSVVEIFLSSKLISITILLGLFANFLYFLLRAKVMKYTRRIFRTY